MNGTEGRSCQCPNLPGSVHVQCPPTTITSHGDPTFPKKVCYCFPTHHIPSPFPWYQALRASGAQYTKAPPINTPP